MVYERVTENPPVVESLANVGDNVQDDFTNEEEINEIEPLQAFSFH